MGIMYADYFLLRERLLILTDLYDCSPRSVYWHRHGMNWRALVAWPMGVWITLPSFAKFVEHSTTKELKSWSNSYDFAACAGIGPFNVDVLSASPRVGCNRDWPS